MVAYAIDESRPLEGRDEQTKPAARYVCPKCFRELMGPAVAGEKNRYGRITRSYFGWCLACDCGFEVIQFKQEGAIGNGSLLSAMMSSDPVTSIQNGWLINRYRLFKKLEGNDKPQPVTAWLTMNSLPVPAPVVTGPGGEYDKPFEPETIDLVETVLAALRATTKTVESLLKLAKLK